MSFYGFNRAALNGGVTGFIAGAALVTAVSGFAADATRVVLPSASPTVTSSVEATGRLALLGAASIEAHSSTLANGGRISFGDGGFIVLSTCTAFPALLQLQTATIVVNSKLQATYTNAWAASFGQVEATGFITRPGAGVASGSATVTAVPKVEVGFASQIDGVSAATADPSVKRSGQTTIQRDGYAQQTITSGFRASGLRTALGYANPAVTSSCTTDSIKIHGGAANFTSVFEVAVVASTDAALATITSDMTATGLLTQHAQVPMPVLFEITADPMVTIPGQANEMGGTSFMTGAGLLALQAGSALGGTVLVTAEGRLALLGQATQAIDSSLSATGEIYKPGAATFSGLSNMAAQWAILVEASAAIVCPSSMTALAFTNTEAPDPASRTMYRPSLDRVMRRPFTDRAMRRQA